MNRDQIINEFVQDKDYPAICRRVAGNDAEDLYQELVLFVLEIPADKLARLNETCLKCFFYRMAKNQYNSTTSTFHRKYRKPNYFVTEHIDAVSQAIHETESVADIIDQIEKSMDAMYWYDAELMRVYAEEGSMRAVSKKTGIPLISIHDTINNTRKTIKAKINQS